MSKTIARPARQQNKLRFLQQRVDHTVQLSAEKAAAHLRNPAQNPLPAGGESLESAIVDMVRTLPRRKQDDFLERMNTALNATAAARQQKFGALASVNFQIATAVADQVKAIPVPDEFKLTNEELPQRSVSPTRKVARTVTGNAMVNRPPLPQQAVVGTILQFAVENITCIETNDRRKDEMVFSAFVADSSGATQERTNFFSADFREGDSKSPGAAGNLFTINLGDSTGGVFPATFAGGVLMVEEGLFGGGDGVETAGAILRVVGKVIAAGSVAVSFIPGAGLPLAFTILGIGTAILFAGDVLLFAGGDEISQVVPDELLFDTPPLAGETFSRTVQVGFIGDGFIKKGEYAIDLRWTVA